MSYSRRRRGGGAVLPQFVRNPEKQPLQHSSDDNKAGIPLSRTDYALKWTRMRQQLEYDKSGQCMAELQAHDAKIKIIDYLVQITQSSN